MRGSDPEVSEVLKMLVWGLMAEGMFWKEAGCPFSLSVNKTLDPTRAALLNFILLWQQGEAVMPAEAQLTSQIVL